jgi:hypothetical protein
MMHNIRLANPLDPAAKAVKEISAKRNKKEEDIRELARREFLGGLYHNESMGYFIPAEAWMATIIEGAKTEKMGKKCKGAVFIEEDSKLSYSGPSDVNERSLDPACFDYRAVRVGNAMVMRCRPVFRDWSCDLRVMFESAEVEHEAITRFLEYTGRLRGILEFRPRFGRFRVESLGVQGLEDAA